jgi:hypothetical protein
MVSLALQALFDRSAPHVLGRQLLFEKEVQGQAWEADVEAGVLSLGERRVRMEVLATYSSQSGTLLWAWARGEVLGQGWPEPAIGASRRLRALGEGVPELEEGMPALSPEEADDVVLAGLGLLGEAGVAGGVPLYYRGDHEHGSFYLLVDAPELVERVEMPALRVVSLFPQLVAMGVPLSSPRAAFVSYCEKHGMTITAGHDTVRAVDGTGSSVTARFDAGGRLEAIDADLQK